MNSENEKTFFKIYHWTILSFGIYLIIYIFAMRLLNECGIQFHCPYLKVTGQKCPLCGVTRDLWSVFSFSSERLNSLTNFIVCAFIIEVCYRVLLCIMWKSSKLWTHIRFLCIADPGGHLVILLLFSAFCVSSL